jgi:hypothetical protein
MSLHSFPKALETAAPSDRGVPPLSVPVAPIAVRCQVYSVTNSSSQAGDDGWPGVPRYISIRSIPGPFSGGRGTSPGVLNLFGPFQAARRSIRALLKFCQEPSRRAADTFKALSSACLHASNKAWSRKYDVHENSASGA